MKRGTQMLLGGVGAIPVALLASGVAIATPRRVAQLMAALLAPEPHHSVLDPCCGAGRLLVAADHARRTAAGRDEDPARFAPLYGQEIQPLPLALARRTLRRRATAARLSGGSSLREPQQGATPGQLLRVDRALANPNWGRPIDPEVYAADAHQRFTLGNPPAECGDWGWFQMLLSHLTPDGRAVMLTGQEVTWRNGTPKEPDAERVIREAVIHSGVLRAVVGNPWPLSRAEGWGTALTKAWLPRACILVADAQPTAQGVLMINPHVLVSAYQRRELTADQVIQELARVHEAREAIPGLSRLVSDQELLRHGGDLTPALYVR